MQRVRDTHALPRRHAQLRPCARSDSHAAVVRAEEIEAPVNCAAVEAHLSTSVRRGSVRRETRQPRDALRFDPRSSALDAQHKADPRGGFRHRSDIGCRLEPQDERGAPRSKRGYFHSLDDADRIEGHGDDERASLGDGGAGAPRECAVAGVALTAEGSGVVQAMGTF